MYRNCLIHRVKSSFQLKNVFLGLFISKCCFFEYWNKNAYRLPFEINNVNFKKVVT